MRLEDVTFRTPCTVPWDSMKGGGSQVRLCGQCDKKVYNLSGMKREEAEAFLDQALGTQCVQLWKRDDGTIVTSDCGKTLRPPVVMRLGGAPVPPPPRQVC
jgi:hypothetical protein